eukprot:GDKJ01015962.1.p1 GENE.GDKJ01015962.1~~GDKJ01015962.1.p1  ORF type:complete len:838 (-),score=124.58 GDKJ01015962.1:478-2991(-)
MFSSPFRAHDGVINVSISMIGTHSERHPLKISTHDSMEEFFQRVQSKLNIPGRRAFTALGVELYDLERVLPDDMIYVSDGEPFVVSQAGDQLGSVVGGYVLRCLVGRGGFGKVFKGEHLETKEVVAIKFISKRSIRDLEDTDRLFTEVQALRDLRHPNIITIYDIVDSPSHFCLVMEYASLGELREFVNKQRRLPEAAARWSISQIIRAVHFCHSRGVVHRDLKLENILLDSDLNCKIVDFGLSSFVPRDGQITTDAGTRSYCAPEVLQRQTNEHSAYLLDVWAIGVILYAMTQGVLPFSVADANALTQLKSKTLFFHPDTSSSLRSLIYQLLEPNASKRLPLSEQMTHFWLRVSCSSMDIQSLKVSPSSSLSSSPRNSESQQQVQPQTQDHFSPDETVNGNDETSIPMTTRGMGNQNNRKGGFNGHGAVTFKHHNNNMISTNTANVFVYDSNNSQMHSTILDNGNGNSNVSSSNTSSFLHHQHRAVSGERISYSPHNGLYGSDEEAVNDINGVDWMKERVMMSPSHSSSADNLIVNNANYEDNSSQFFYYHDESNNQKYSTASSNQQSKTFNDHGNNAFKEQLSGSFLNNNINNLTIKEQSNNARRPETTPTGPGSQRHQLPSNNYIRNKNNIHNVSNRSASGSRAIGSPSSASLAVISHFESPLSIGADSRPRREHSITAYPTHSGNHGNNRQQGTAARENSSSPIPRYMQTTASRKASLAANEAARRSAWSTATGSVCGRVTMLDHRGSALGAQTVSGVSPIGGGGNLSNSRTTGRLSSVGGRIVGGGGGASSSPGRKSFVSGLGGDLEIEIESPPKTVERKRRQTIIGGGSLL